MNHEIIEPSEVIENEKNSNWKSIIIYAAVMITLGVGIGFLVSVLTKNYAYVEIICGIFGILSLLFMMLRIRARDSGNLKKNKTITEDKQTISYKNWFRMQIAMLIVGVILLAMSYIFFLIFIA